jgi:hypothetical protein
MLVISSANCWYGPGVRLLWDSRGGRRVPSVRAFDQAVSRLPRGELERICEFNPHGPIYFIPTRPFLRALARKIGKRRVVEVAAGDGHLARELTKIGVNVIATDSGKWERPQARMNAREKRALRGTNVAGLKLGANVVRMDAIEAIRKLEPDLVLATWLPPGPLLGKIIREAKNVIEIGAGSGITGDIRCWRYEHEFLEDLDELGRCRLDERPALELHTRVTLYERPVPRRRG